VRRLGELKDSRAIDFLLKAYKDETYTMQIAEAPPGVKASVILALSQIGGERARSEILKILKGTIEIGPREETKIMCYDNLFGDILDYAVRFLSNWKDDEVYKLFYYMATSETSSLAEYDDPRIYAYMYFIRREMDLKGISTIKGRVDYLVDQYPDTYSGMIRPGISSVETIIKKGIGCNLTEMGMDAAPFLKARIDKMPQSPKKICLNGELNSIRFMAEQRYTPTWVRPW